MSINLPKRTNVLRILGAISFLVAIAFFAGVYLNTDNGIMLIVAAVVGGYMAMNIGANDVANNVGPAVGSKALTMGGAIIVAAVFEASGALVAGGEVVGTIKKSIIDPGLIPDSNTFIWLMLAALLAGALWLNIATSVGAPVSTTHSIVGGVLGAGIAAGGFDIANWGTMGKIAASWIISPFMGGGIAAAFLYLIKRTITYQSDLIAATKKMLPVLVGLMAWACSSYLILKGLKKIWKTDLLTALGIGLVICLVIYWLLRPVVAKTAENLPNDKASVNRLFNIPLIFAAAMLSFAHGANDVANAVGPLAAINDAISHGGIASKAAIPLWVMMIGALGIALGLALYGPRLIRSVGSEITELDQMRAFCIAMAAAITVIIASQLGLPVSSTHIAVGGVFGVGFLREYLKTNYASMLEDIRSHHQGKGQDKIDALIAEFERATVEEKARIVKQIKKQGKQSGLTKSERKKMRKVVKSNLVKRSMFYKIITAWLVTVPASGLMAAMLYFMIRGMMLP
jgi:PiT family inorganic phosphate transporter